MKNFLEERKEKIENPPPYCAASIYIVASKLLYYAQHDTLVE